MNHIYRIVWNHSNACWQAVSEIGKGRHKVKAVKEASSGDSPIFVKIRPLALLVSLLSTGLAVAAPTGGQVTVGKAEIQHQGAVTNIHQSSQNAAINWQNFSVKPQETVNFHQPNRDAITLNRVIGNERSVIEGAINANGNVFISNPNGVLIGGGSQINVGSLVATTQKISDEDFRNGKFQFNGKGNGKVENLGNITVPKGGVVALIAPVVKNQGKIIAPQGKVVLASAEAFRISLPNEHFSYTVERGTLQGLVDNGGAILAENGQVVLTAKGLSAVKKSVIKHTGVIEANRVVNKGGVVELLGDLDNSELHFSGTINAKGKGNADGGFVETSAAKLKIDNKAKVSTKSEKGKTGKWVIDPKDFTVAKSGGDMTGEQVSRNLADSNVELKSRTGAKEGKGDVVINDEISWDKNTLTLNADNDIHINKTLNGSGTAKLALKFGQNHTTGNTFVAEGGDIFLEKDTPLEHRTTKINLPEGKNLIIQKGSNGQPIIYDVIHRLPDIKPDGFTDGFTSKYIALGKDLDVGYTKNIKGFAGWGKDATPHSGAYLDFEHFEGLGHSISNLSINLPEPFETEKSYFYSSKFTPENTSNSLLTGVNSNRDADEILLGEAYTIHINFTDSTGHRNILHVNSHGEGQWSLGYSSGQIEGISLNSDEGKVVFEKGVIKPNTEVSIWQATRLEEVGLFRYVGMGSSLISNLRVENANIYAPGYSGVGIVVGTDDEEDGDIVRFEDVYISGSLTARNGKTPVLKGKAIGYGDRDEGEDENNHRDNNYQPNPKPTVDANELKKANNLTNIVLQYKSQLEDLYRQANADGMITEKEHKELEDANNQFKQRRQAVLDVVNALNDSQDKKALRIKLLKAQPITVPAVTPQPEKPEPTVDANELKKANNLTNIVLQDKSQLDNLYRQAKADGVITEKEHKELEDANNQFKQSRQAVLDVVNALNDSQDKKALRIKLLKAQPITVPAVTPQPEKPKPTVDTKALETANNLTNVALQYNSQLQALYRQAHADGVITVAEHNELENANNRFKQSKQSALSAVDKLNGKERTELRIKLFKAQPITVPAVTPQPEKPKPTVDTKALETANNLTNVALQYNSQLQALYRQAHADGVITVAEHNELENANNRFKQSKQSALSAVDKLNGKERTELRIKLFKAQPITVPAVTTANDTQIEKETRKQYQSLEKTAKAGEALISVDLSNRDIKPKIGKVEFSLKEMFIVDPLLESTVNTVFSSIFSKQFIAYIEQLGWPVPTIWNGNQLTIMDAMLDPYQSDFLKNAFSKYKITSLADLKQLGGSVAQDLAINFIKESIKIHMMKNWDIHDEWKGLLIDVIGDGIQSVYSSNGNPHLLGAYALQKISLIALKQSKKALEKLSEVNDMVKEDISRMKDSLLDYRLKKVDLDMKKMLGQDVRTYYGSAHYNSVLDNFAESFDLNKNDIEAINNDLSDILNMQLADKHLAKRKIQDLYKKYPQTVKEKATSLVQSTSISRKLTTVTTQVVGGTIEYFSNDPYSKEALANIRQKTTNRSLGGIHSNKDYIDVMLKILALDNLK